MTKLSTALVMALLAAAISCKKENSDNDKPSVKDKLQGKWQMTRQEDQRWEPIDVMQWTQDNPILPGDSIVITQNKIYGYYDDQSGVQVGELPLIVLSDSILVYDDKPFIIRKLTDTELVLYQEDVDVANNRKDVIINYLVR